MMLGKAINYAINQFENSATILMMAGLKWIETELNERLNYL